MPQLSNIAAPACLVGSGRSGTTLVTAILRRHPQVQALGETGNLVFSTLYHIERTLPLCGPTFDKDSAPGAAVEQVHRMMVDLFPSDAPRWFHKPIMLPSVRRMFKQDDQFNGWFWDACGRLFPQARWFTVVRDWRDVALSSMQRWNWTAEVAMKSQTRVAEMLLHPDSRVGMFVDFAALVGEPEATTRRILDFLDLPFDAACLGAFNQIHAPNRSGDGQDTVDDLRQRGYVRHAEGEPSFKSRALDRLHAELVARTRAAAV